MRNWWLTEEVTGVFVYVADGLGRIRTVSKLINKKTSQPYGGVQSCTTYDKSSAHVKVIYRVFVFNLLVYLHI